MSPRSGQLDPEQKEIVRELLSGAIPLNPTANPFVTHDELDKALEHIDVKIDNAALRQKLWVLGGVVAVMISVFTSYAALVSKIDRLSEALPALSQVQADRSKWISRTDQRDTLQDQSLKKLDREYQPLPYQAPPQ